MTDSLEIDETISMITQEKLDVRTITMGISLLDCVSDNLGTLRDKILRKITTKAKDLVAVGRQLEVEFGIPIVNKRISVTPISLVAAGAAKSIDDYAAICRTLDQAAEETGVNFLGGYSALVSKSMTPADELLIRSLPPSPLLHGKGVRFSQCGLHQDRDRHGCGGASGPCDQKGFSGHGRS